MRRVLCGIKGNEQSQALEKVSQATKISEEIDQLLEERNGVVHDKLSKILLPMKDIQHHGTFIIHGFENSFLQKESARDENFKFFEFVSSRLSTWVQHVP